MKQLQNAKGEMACPLFKYLPFNMLKYWTVIFDNLKGTSAHPQPTTSVQPLRDSRLGKLQKLHSHTTTSSAIYLVDIHQTIR